MIVYNTTKGIMVDAISLSIVDGALVAAMSNGYSRPIYCPKSDMIPAKELLGRVYQSILNCAPAFRIDESKLIVKQKAKPILEQEIAVCPACDKKFMIVMQTAYAITTCPACDKKFEVYLTVLNKEKNRVGPCAGCEKWQSNTDGCRSCNDNPVYK